MEAQSLSITNIYRSLCTHPIGKGKTTFHTRYGYFEYTIMPFGLMNVLEMIKNMVNDIFRDFFDVDHNIS